MQSRFLDALTLTGWSSERIALTVGMVAVRGCLKPCACRAATSRVSQRPRQQPRLSTPTTPHLFRPRFRRQPLSCSCYEPLAASSLTWTCMTSWPPVRLPMFFSGFDGSEEPRRRRTRISEPLQQHSRRRNFSVSSSMFAMAAAASACIDIKHCHVHADLVLQQLDHLAVAQHQSFF